MKYSAIYSNKIKLNDFDEIIIIYDAQDGALPKFLQAHENQHIILSIANVPDFIDTQEWKKLNAIYEKYPNFSIRFGGVGAFRELPENIIEFLQSDVLTMPYFFGMIAVNFDQLNYILNLGVSQVYLGEDICFSLDSAKRLCKQHQVAVRAFPNVAQSSVKATPALKKFFIRPEDTVEYTHYIDTLEFWGPTDRQEILLRIYKKGVPFNDLNDLILDFNFNFDSRRILPGFARIRSSCNRRCMKGTPCSICDRFLSISEKLSEKGLVIRHKKKD